MNILGVDYGTKNVGLAVGDTASQMVFPLRSIDRGGRNDDQLIAELLEIAKAEGAGRFVVGLPRQMRQGHAPSKMENAVRAFVERLRSKTDLTVDTEDERLTSKVAERKRLMFGVSKKKYDKDAAAAAEILQTFIDSRSRRDDTDWLNQ